MPSKHASTVSGVAAVVIRENHKWFALYRRNDFECRKCHLSSDDAWNFDIDRGLEVTVTVDETVALNVEGKPDPKGAYSRCEIQRRRGNKKFIKIGEGK